MDGSSEVLPASLVDAALAGATSVGAESRTLPPGAYTSAAFFELEMEKIFRKDWICVGHVSQVAKVGDYFTVDLFGELLVVVRGHDRIRVMSRVCLHRWAPVATGSGNAKLFSCPFHKWGYALDGQLLGAPFMEQAAGFTPKDCKLPEVRSEIVEALGMIYITFSETATSISDRLASLSEYLAPSAMNQMVVCQVVETENDYNWKILIETFMECYHHIGAHRDTLEPTFPARLSYVEDEKPGWSLCHSKVREELECEAYMSPATTPFSLYLVYPLVLLGGPMDPARTDRIELLTITPIAANRVRTRRHVLLRPEVVGTPLEQEKLGVMTEFLADVINEDNAVNDMQQIGAASRLAETGRLSHLEYSVWHLAEYVRRQLAAN